jgi:endoglucanase
MQIHASLYSSNGFWDELSWAAYWMYRATGKNAYLDQAKSYYAKANKGYNVFEMNNKRPALSVLLTNSADSRFRKDAIEFFDSYLNQYQQHTNRGLAYPYHWGAARHGPNVAFLAMSFAAKSKVDASYKNRLRHYAAFQINYILGDSGRSWMVGFGKGYTQYAWHKPSYNSYLDWDPKLAEKVYAMPDAGPWASSLKGSKSAYVEKGKLDFESSRYPQRRVAYGHLMTPLINDHMIVARKDYTYAETTIEYQSGFTNALAAFAGWYKQGPYDKPMKDVLARP